ncbi:MAG: VOC family protein [Nocardioides sp.]
MAADLFALCLGAHDPRGVGRFWAEVLGRELTDGGHGADSVALLPTDDTGLRLEVFGSPAEKVGENRAHFDLTSSTPQEQEETVARALRNGARHIDVGQLPEEGHVVLADPEGNEFCVLEAGNDFLAGCGLVGALAGDGSQQVGYFWSEALGWPLVWDQDEETAIQSPRGGTKITWGGPPLMPRLGTDRFHHDLVAAAGDDPRQEIDRLVALGAHLGAGGGDAGRVLLVDPDGNEFCLLVSRT